MRLVPSLRRRRRGPEMRAAVRGAIAVALLTAACGGEAVSPTPSAPDATPSPEASPAPVTVADLARAVAQIVTFVDGRPEALGSGTIVSPDGLVLTNAHVITPETGELDRVEIGITDRSDAPPEPAYEAEVVAADAALDLAVLRITATLDGGDVPTDLPYVRIGDSEALEIGDPLRILGYPGIGGETITLTSGQVSGFVSEAGLGRRAWIKTDATIAGGNSGGLAANDGGELVAIPTVAGAGSTDEVVDCRPIRDTNRDGAIDDEDDCVPIGGFLNGLRPVALARAMLDAVIAGEPYEPIVAAEPDPPLGTGDLDDVSFSPPTFGSDVTDDDEPVDPGIAFDTSITSLCAFWEFEGMETGLGWSAEWWVDGELEEAGSFLGETWSFDSSGTFWVCLDNGAGVAAGLYDIVFLVEDEVFSTGYVHVGDDLETASVTIRNDGPTEICYLFASPVTSTVWGPDQLDDTQILSTGESATIELVAADYDVAGNDCDFADLFEVSTSVTPPSVTLTWDGSALRGSGGDGGGGGGTGTTDLRVGECFIGDGGWNRATTDIVPCDEPHQRQIAGLFTWPGSGTAYPGEAALDDFATANCFDAFAAFVGISYDESIWYMSTWTPTAQTWASGDRIVLCALELEDESLFTGSKQGVRE